jgi:galactose oxidase
MLVWLRSCMPGTMRVYMVALMLSSRRGAHLLVAAGLAALSVTCGGDDLTRSTPRGDELAATAGPPANITITRQPPASALDQEVWDPSTQPIVAVKDADDVAAPRILVTATIASGTGILQGTLTTMTGSNGTTAFTDLGIAGTGPHTLSFATSSVFATSSTITLNALPPEAATGKWDPPSDWEIVPLHINLLPTGKILAWGKREPDGRMGMPRLWDPASGPPTSARMVPVDTMLFCGGHALMADGRLMVSGGHKADNRGLDVTNIFDPTTESWVSGLPKMAKGRWYPTVTTLADGRLVTVVGRDTAAQVVLIPEIWENNQWVQLSGASLSLPYYPRQFLAPNGKIFYAGERVKARWLDVDVVTANGRGQWTSSTGLTHLWPYNRDYGSAVMYETGKILYVGGGGNLNWATADPRANTPTETAETIDLNVIGPRWSSTGSMNFPRRHLNATILPNGHVLVTGGTSAGGFNTLSGSVHAAEAWDPQTGQWTQLASNTIDRAYHSVSLLLPDATVLHGASGDADVLGSPEPYPRQVNHEIFRPPYLFKGVRPTITGVSKATVTYGEKFAVTTPYAAQITKVRLIRLGSVTHAFDANQRANSLTMSRGSGLVRVTAPTSARRAPPGHYLLFLLNRNGVPSVGTIVQVQ